MRKYSKTNKALTLMCVSLFLVIVLGVLSLCFLTNVKQGNSYYTKQEVAQYVYKFKTLPKNFLTKNEMKDKTFDEAAELNVGGDTFYNKENLIDNPNNLPMAECDIYDAEHNAKNRGAQRMVFFTDGSKVFYTSDHYETFVYMSSWEINKLSYIFAGAAAVSLVVYLATLCFVAKVKKDGKAHVELSFEIDVVATLLVALSPLALVLWVIYAIDDKVKEKRNSAASK